MTVVSVTGIGWITREEYGGSAQGGRFRRDDDGSIDRLFRTGLFAYPFKNYGRLDAVSRMTAIAVALAFRDAQMSYSAGDRRDIGIIGTGSAGSLASDLAYFKDYLDCGRTLARGNLFIYTLPSSALGETAIHFGLQGPLLYLTDERASLAAALECAGDMLLLGEAEIMLAGVVEEQAALFAVLGTGRAVGSGALCGLDEARAIANAGISLPGCIAQFRTRKAQKGGS